MKGPRKPTPYPDELIDCMEEIEDAVRATQAAAELEILLRQLDLLRGAVVPATGDPNP